VLTDWICTADRRLLQEYFALDFRHSLATVYIIALELSNILLYFQQFQIWNAELILNTWEIFLVVT